MIQFNLLPDVKLAYIKAERTKRLMISISVLASAVAVVIFVLLFSVVNIEQKKNISDLNHDIKSTTAQVQGTPNLNKVLTLQNQLSTLTDLHNQKPAVSRLYDYLGQITPSTVTISNVNADFAQKTITITGNAPSLDIVNTYVDTLKFTTYKTDASSDDTNAFTGVVLSSFSRSSTSAGYTISFSYDPNIFDTTKQVTLTVPKTITTRSVQGQNNPALFQTNTSTQKEQQ